MPRGTITPQWPVQASAEELSVNGFRTVMEIDAIGTFAASRAAFPALRARGGSIINISATLHYGATWWQVPTSKTLHLLIF
jgi:peroxisomal 2,4-dienoyl-CoA reductase